MKENNKIFYVRLLIIFLSSIIAFFGCATNPLSLKPPKTQVTDLKLVNASFEKVDLALGVKISNSYPFSATLPGFDYNLKINNSTFIQGSEEINQTISAFNETLVQIPVTVNFLELYNSFKSLKKSDHSTYSLSGGIYISLPIIGKIRVPFEKHGELPLLKMPKIKVNALRLKRINLAGADLSLEINMKNSNAFSMLLNTFSYNFSINGQSWANGHSNTPVRINEKNEGLIKIPIKLNFFEIGRTAYNLLSGGKDLSYDFNTDLDLNTSLPLLKNVKLPVKKSGTINIIR